MKILEVLGFLLALQGLVGIVGHFTGWDVGLLRRLHFLDGYQIFAGIVLIVLGAAILIAVDRTKS